jgi:hypothetical protein
MLVKPVLSLLLVPAALALGACGSDSKSEESHEEQATPATAIAEIGETRDGLIAALATYKSGDKKAAEEQAAEAYLQHFEIVEGPLEAKDKELTAKLEDTIREELRDAMKAGKPAAEIEETVNGVLADLEKAETALR